MTAEVGADTAFHPDIPRPLFDIRRASRTNSVDLADLFWWDVSPDGKKFLVEMASEENRGSPITVVPLHRM